MEIPIDLLPGEVKSYVEHNIFFCPSNNNGVVQSGILVITNYRFAFGGSRIHIDVPLGLISRVDKIGGVTSKKEHGYRIEVVLKDMRNLQFALNPENHGRRTMYERLKTYAFPLNSKRKVFAFANAEQFEVNGWKLYDPISEYKRILDPNDPNWVISDINENYNFCDTYPSVLVIPNEHLVSKGVLKSVAAFRSRNRLPVLTWRHSNGATLTRCSQPLTGVKNKRSSDDEYYLSIIRSTNPKSPRLAIMDARPRANAIANRTRNGGYESEDVYKSTDIVFLNIHNIHVMRDSFNKLKEVINSGKYTDWTKAIEATSWLKHIRRVLQGSWHVIEQLQCGTSVLVHCSDGWDRTAQLTALSMLLMDPYYRTLVGFEVLIEKEWLSFGHKFQQRIGHGDHHHSDQDRSPIFLQFLDCVWQLTTQFPAAFEFNELFLVTIVENLYSCRFGTFLLNCERERIQWQLKDKTVSLWSFINSTQEIYKNQNFHPKEDVLKPQMGRNVRLWEGLYCRWAPKDSSNYEMGFLNQTTDANAFLVSLVPPQ